MAVGPTDIELRVRNLERAVQWLMRMLRNAGKMARQGLENSMDPAQQGGGGGQGTQIFRAVVTTAIPAPASATAAATNSGRATIQLRNKTTGAYATHPLFATPQVIWNGYPNTATTATVGKVIYVAYDGSDFEMLNENCT